MSSTARLVAHRGHPARFPDNSLAGIRSAIKAGAAFIEVDVQLSADLEPVLFHDRDLRRMCGTDGSVHQFTLPELAELDASESRKFAGKFAGVRIAALSEFCQLIEQQPEVRVFVELKRISIEHFGAEVVWRAVEQHLRPISAQTVIISFHQDILLLARKAGWPVGVVLETWRDRLPDVIKPLDPAFIFIAINKLPESGKLSIDDAQLVAYDTTSPELAKALIGRGVNMVETFDIRGMLAALRET
ncbi:MAG: glycerophosphodiester phosphodiesterase family protein [Mariprofundaceae bacterium]